MKCFVLISILTCSISSFGISPPSNNNKSTLTSIIQPTLLKDTLNKKDFLKLKIKEYEKYTGKKLTLKEKIAFKIVQGNLKKELRTDPQTPAASKGKTALILGIIGIVLVFVPYVTIAALPLSIIAIVMGNEAKEIDPSDKKARTAVVLGWVTLGVFFILLVLAFALLIVFLGGFG